MCLGDSITHFGYCEYYLQLFENLRHPGSAVRYVNAGYSGGTVGTGLNRLPLETDRIRPDRAFVMFGMNDVRWTDYVTNAVMSAERRQAADKALATYRADLPKLVDRILASGVRDLTLVTPTPYDEYSTVLGPRRKFVNEYGLSLAAESVRRLAAEKGLKVVDLHAALSDACRANPEKKLCGGDSVHPGKTGHLLMASVYWRTLGYDRPVAAVTLDASGTVIRVENAEVSDVSATASALAFDYTPGALPFPDCPEYGEVKAINPDFARFNREPLVVVGLKAGDWELLVDGRKLGTFSSEILSRGVNLAELDTPNRRQATKAMEAAYRLHDFDVPRRDVACVRGSFEKFGVDMNDRDALAKRSEERLAKLKAEKYRWYDWEKAASEKFLASVGREAEIAAEENRLYEAIAAPRPVTCRVEIRRRTADVGFPGSDFVPNARFGILSDIHLAADDSVQDGFFADALRYFDSRKVDGVVVCGDLTRLGMISELRKVGEVWNKVFPGDRRSDGGHVEKLFICGDHETENMFCPIYTNAWSKIEGKMEAMRKADIYSNDRAKQWKDSFGEDYAPIMRKRVRGYDFVLAHLVMADEPGLRWGEPLHIPGLEDFFATNAFDATKPFFYVQHMIPRGTVGAPELKRPDSGRTTAILSRHPNAVVLCGHKHRCAMDEHSLWQGEFTVLEVPALLMLSTPCGHENSRCSCIGLKTDPPFQMPPLDTMPDGKQGLVMSVYDDRIVFERRDFFFGEEYAEPWVVPLPNDGRASFEARAKAAGIPRFPVDAKVSVRMCKGRDRAGTPTDQVEVSFPVAHTTASSPRAFDYEVRAVLRKMYVTRIAATKRVFSKKCYWPEAHDTNVVTCVFAKREIPSWHDSLVFEVYPLNAFGVAGGPIASEPVTCDPTPPRPY